MIREAQENGKREDRSSVLVFDFYSWRSKISPPRIGDYVAHQPVDVPAIFVGGSTQAFAISSTRMRETSRMMGYHRDRNGRASGENDPKQGRCSVVLPDTH